jgi:oligoribonuclease
MPSPEHSGVVMYSRGTDVIVWFAAETSDLHERDGHLLEVALIVTDDGLRETASFESVVNPVGMTVDRMHMPDKIYTRHVKSGLIADLRRGKGVGRSEVQDRMLEFCRRHVSGEDVSQIPLAGANIGFDRRWMRVHLPEVEELFSYRSIDTGAIGELALRFSRASYDMRPRWTELCRALASARFGVEQLRHYRSDGFLRTLDAFG